MRGRRRDLTARAQVAQAPYSVEFDSGILANGEHAVAARAWDAAGNHGTSAPTSVHLVGRDVVPPPDDGVDMSGWTNTSPVAFVHSKVALDVVAAEAPCEYAAGEWLESTSLAPGWPETPWNHAMPPAAQPFRGKL